MVFWALKHNIVICRRFHSGLHGGEGSRVTEVITSSNNDNPWLLRFFKDGYDFCAKFFQPRLPAVFLQLDIAIVRKP